MNLMGQPDEVRIYGPPFVQDAQNQWSGQFKYKGKFVYDPMGRLLEEQMMDSKGALVRRRVQDYDINGEPLPIETFYDDARIPNDLRLVVNKELFGGIAMDPEMEAKLNEINRRYNQQKSKGFFANRKRKQAEEQAAQLQRQMSPSSPPVYQGTAQPVPAATAAPAQTAKKGFQLFRRRSSN